MRANAFDGAQPGECGKVEDVLVRLEGGAGGEVVGAAGQHGAWPGSEGGESVLEPGRAQEAGQVTPGLFGTYDRGGAAAVSRPASRRP